MRLEMGGRFKREGYIYTYGWFILRLDRKQENYVKQLFFNKSIFKGGGVLRPHTPKNQNRNTIVMNSIKIFKMAHIKKNI